MANQKFKSKVQIDAGLQITSETSDKALQLDANGNVQASTVTTTELAHLSGVTSDIQTQIDNKASTSDLNTHVTDTNNPHDVTKAQVGLSNVPNVDATQRANHTGTQLASTISDFDAAAKAAAVADSITDGVTTVAPSQNAVFDALAGYGVKTLASSGTQYVMTLTSERFTTITGSTAQTILLPASPYNGLTEAFNNRSSAAVTLRDSGDTTTILTIPANHNATVRYNGTTWGGNSSFYLNSGVYNAATGKISNLGAPTAGSNDAATTNYVDAKVADGIVDGVTTIAPSQNAVYDALLAKIDAAQKGAANGVATLDAGGKIPASQLPDSVFELKGAYDASTNTPSLVDGVGNPGDVYKVTVAGTQDFGSGSIILAVNDLLLYGSDGVYFKSDSTDNVLSVNGQQGIVVLTTDDVSEGSTNKYFTVEATQDAIGSALLDTDTVNLTYNDGANTISADVNVQMSITSDSSGIKLSGDASTPGNTKYYGTDSSGVKGFYSIPNTGASAGDISETSFSLANNQTSPANVTGLAFSTAVVRSFKALVSVEIDATSDTFEAFELIGIQKGASFDMAISSVGDDSGVVFSITSAGQVQYTSANDVGFVSGAIKYRVITTSV